ncbi:SDR family NAD(P)-dependent oxidoreductase [Streptomyces albipurpureus]|uniref:SDR family oxidoreductase n=1 Tax=Streptomyces albipurpureus TaxID=2897419 RepID=A0ABT0UQU5_9ACTN|nr:SDR family NAD(P)-dependent oxidoreductase [Streptomyces sp. CWNU-1]MCM2390979.1 SDR family oxidoreductase [Streptomyces sp. CWNU-1]
MNPLSGTRAERRMVVTGSRSGIGRATATLAASLGWTVIGLDLVADDQPAPDGDGIITFPCDITDELSVRRAFEQVDRAWGGQAPTAVVHCAGVYRFKAAIETTAAEWDTVVDINARGSLLVAAAAARRMLTTGDGGSVTLMSSIAAVRGDGGEPSAAYSASKGAVVSLARQLAVEWGPRGIRCNVVAPGVIDTPMTTVSGTPEIFDQVLQRIPARRLGSAEEVAQVCLFLASEQSSYVNGTVIAVDGGQSAS